jgi:hypothetical protein
MAREATLIAFKIFLFSFLLIQYLILLRLSVFLISLDPFVLN